MSADLELRAALLRLDLAAVEVSASLDAAGISSLLLKGPSFADWLYEHPRDRLYTDVDVLVPVDRLEDVRAVLTSSGYRFDSDHPLGIHLTFYRSGSDARIEIHTTLLGLGVSAAEAWHVLSEHAESLSLIGREVRHLDDIGRALHVLLHAACEGEGHTLDDLERALDRLDPHRWADVLELADRLAARDAFVEGMGMARRGEEVLGELGVSREVSLSVRLRSEKASNASQLLALIAETPGFRRRLELVRRALFPSPALMRQRYAYARRGRAGLLAMYLVRAVVSPAKAVAAVPSWSSRRWAGSRSARP